MHSSVRVSQNREDTEEHDVDSCRGNLYLSGPPIKIRTINEVLGGQFASCHNETTATVKGL